MQRILSESEYLSIPVVELAPRPVTSSNDSESKRRCAPCAAYRPDPQMSGNLQVDPDILLPSPGMPV